MVHLNIIYPDYWLSGPSFNFVPHVLSLLLLLLCVRIYVTILKPTGADPIITHVFTREKKTKHKAGACWFPMAAKQTTTNLVA